MANLCIRTPPEMGEKIRKLLAEHSHLDNSRRIVKDGDYLYIPVKDDIDNPSLKKYWSSNIELVEFGSADVEPRLRNYRDLLVDRLNKRQLELLPRSFDMVGHVAVIKLPGELKDSQHAIGDAIISANKNIRTVYHSLGVHDEYRVLELQLISGDDEPVTMHSEFGIRLELNLKRVYFSPRLATERHRITALVEDGELVVDMFAGVGPFSIMIAKYADPKKVISIDRNPDAIFYLKRNIDLNKVENIEPMEGDAGVRIANLQDRGPVGRVIMNLPHSSFQFLPDAISAVAEKGFIHYYEMIDKTKIDERVGQLQKTGQATGKELKHAGHRIVHTYSPSESLVAFDLQVMSSHQP